MNVEPFLGEIGVFAGNFTIREWGYCGGALINISNNTALFSIIGSTYGGDGRTTFALPDLRGRSAVNWGTGPGLTPIQYGMSYGWENITLSMMDMPSHSHTIEMASGTNMVAEMNATTSAGSSATPSTSLGYAGFPTIGSGPGATPVNAFKAEDNTASLPVSITGISGVSLNMAGNSSNVSMIPPQLGLNWQMAMEGTYPSRN